MTAKHAHLLNNIIEQPHAWPGGYERHAITDDGGVLCHSCCSNERERIEQATPGDGFYIVALEINWETDSLQCDHCNRTIPPEYAA